MRRVGRFRFGRQTRFEAHPVRPRRPSSDRGSRIIIARDAPWFPLSVESTTRRPAKSREDGSPPQESRIAPPRDSPAGYVK